ncbi:hypothetical protein [Pseudoalteromonas piscicida]
MTKSNTQGHLAFAMAILMITWLSSNLGLHLFLIFNALLLLFYVTTNTKFYLGKEVFIFIISSVVLYSGFIRFPGEIADNTAYLGSVLYCFTGMFAARLLFRFDRNVIVLTLNIIFAFFFLVVFVQHFFYFSFGYYVDFHSVLTLFNYESRYTNNISFLSYFPRSTGLYQEPSNFSIILASLAALSLLYDYKKGFFRFCVLSIFTISVAGVIVSLGMLICYYFFRFSNVRKYFLVLFLVLLPFLLVPFIAFLESIELGYNAVGYRQRVFMLFESMSLTEWLVGFGLFFFEEPIAIYDISLNSSHIKDSGFFANTLFSNGIIGLSVFVLWLFLKLKDLLLISIFMLFFLFKVDMNMPAFWFVIYSVHFYKMNSCR